MTVASQAEAGEERSQRQLVSSLEQTLDDAVESQRYLVAIARRAKNQAGERALATRRPTHAALARGDGSDSRRLRSARPSAPVPASPPARSGARAEAAPLGQHAASQVNGWVGVCAVELGLLALLVAFLLPVSTSPARGPTGGLSATTTLTAGPPVEQARDLRSIATDVAKDEPHPLDPRSPIQQQPTAAREGAARAALDGRPEPAQSSEGPATQREQPRTAPALAEKRAAVVTVNDLFGVGGNEPLPPEALEAPAAPPRARTSKPVHRAPAPSSLFYERLPF